MKKWKTVVFIVLGLLYLGVAIRGFMLWSQAKLFEFYFALFGEGIVFVAHPVATSIFYLGLLIAPFFYLLITFGLLRRKRWVLKVLIVMVILGIPIQIATMIAAPKTYAAMDPTLVLTSGLFYLVINGVVIFFVYKNT